MLSHKILTPKFSGTSKQITDSLLWSRYQCAVTFKVRATRPGQFRGRSRPMRNSSSPHSMVPSTWVWIEFELSWVWAGKMPKVQNSKQIYAWPCFQKGIPRSRRTKRAPCACSVARRVMTFFCIWKKIAILIFNCPKNFSLSIYQDQNWLSWAIWNVTLKILWRWAFLHSEMT